MALVALLSAGGCRWNQKQYASLAPRFTLWYPASWHVTGAADEYGPKTVFSPDGEVRADSARITLQLIPAEPRSRPGEGLAAPNVVVEAPVGLTTSGLMAHRWLVTMYPSAVLVEAYARPERFDTIRQVAGSMVEDIRDSSQPAPEAAAAGNYKSLIKSRTVPWGKSR